MRHRARRARGGVLGGVRCSAQMGGKNREAKFGKSVRARATSQSESQWFDRRA